MYRGSQIAVLLAVSCATAAAADRILGVAEAGKPFLVGSVETKPEAGPVPLVDGDRVQSLGNAVSFRLEGENRAVLPENSTATLRRYGTDGVYFYLTKGAIRFEARNESLAICAHNRLYIPSIPASGQISIENEGAQVRMTSGTMLRPGTAACGGDVAPPVSMAPGAPGSATATATAASAGAATSAATAGAVAIAAGATAGLASSLALASSSPAAESPITPAQ